MSKEKPLIYVIAGEPSGDLLGARLIEALREKTGGKASFAGVGGTSMEEKDGFTSLFDISDLAVMGLFEVIPSIPKVLKLIKRTLIDIEEKKPDIIVTIDSWGFTGRINKALYKKGSKIPRVHYVAPQVWAWKKGRAKRMNGVVNHLLTLLAKEPKYFTPYGLKTTHVGHPVIETKYKKNFDETDFRTKFDIPQDNKIMSILPGSRHNEVSRLLPVFLQAYQVLSEKNRKLTAVIPVVQTVKDMVLEYIEEYGKDLSIIIVETEQDRYDLFQSSDVAVAASGTVSLELSILKVPHIIAYKVSSLTAILARKLLKIKYVNLTNILLKKRVIPEMLQEKCNPEDLCFELVKLLYDDREAKKQVKESYKVIEELKPEQSDESPSKNAANIILSMLEE